MEEIKYRGAENFCLPICPKCNNTKHVSRPSTIKLDSYGDYYCSDCDLLWHKNKPDTISIDRYDRVYR